MAHPPDGWSGGSGLGRCRVEVLLSLGLLLATYGVGWWRLRRRAPRPVRTWGPAYYLTGIGAVGLALLPPINPVAEQVFSVHMIQHLLLIKVAAPCLLLANPLPAVLWGLPGFLRARVGSLLLPGTPLRTGLGALTSMPLTGLTYALTLWLWHVPVAYDAALTLPSLHDAEHVTFLGAAILFWWPLIRPAPHVRGAVGPGLGVAYLVLAAFQEAILGLALVLAPEVLYRSYAAAPRPVGVDPLEDQAWAGLLMWGAGGVIDMLATTALLDHVLDRRGRLRASAGR